jgi:hypothetical protein
MQNPFPSLLTLALFVSLTLPGPAAAQECTYVDGHPSAAEFWKLDPDEAPDTINDAGQSLLLLAGARLPDNRDALLCDIFGWDCILDFWPRTEGIVWDDGNYAPDCAGCGPSLPGPRWVFGASSHPGGTYSALNGPLLVKVIAVDRDCFESDTGFGRTHMYLHSPLQQPLEASAQATDPGSFQGCRHADRRTPTGRGFSGLNNAAVVLTGFQMPGWGFGEWVSVEQSSDENTPSFVVAHDEMCDDFPVEARSSAFGMLGGAVPARFIGPGSAEPAPHDVAGSYTSQTIGSGQNTTVMARMSDAVCYLTEYGGMFIYDAELAEVHSTFHEGAWHWALTTRAYDDGSVRAAANCYAYNQRTTPRPPHTPMPRPPGPITPRPPR